MDQSAQLEQRFLEIIDDIENEVTRNHQALIAFLQAQRLQIKDRASGAIVELDD